MGSDAIQTVLPEIRAQPTQSFVGPLHLDMAVAHGKLETVRVAQYLQYGLWDVDVARPPLPVVNYGHGKFFGVLGPNGHLELVQLSTIYVTDRFHEVQARMTFQAAFLVFLTPVAWLLPAIADELMVPAAPSSNQAAAAAGAALRPAGISVAFPSR